MRARDSGRVEGTPEVVRPEQAERPLSLAELNTTWDLESDRGQDRTRTGRSYVSFQRSPALARLGNGLYRAMILTQTGVGELPERVVDAEASGFLSGFMGATSGVVDVRSMVWVRGPTIGRNSRWSSIEYNHEGQSVKLFSVVFQAGDSLAVVATIGHQSRARLQDSVSLATDVAELLVGRDSPDIVVPRARGT